MSPRGMEFLPTKVAHQEKVSMKTTMMQRPNLQELVKEAMEGTVSKVDISAEAVRQLANVGVELPEQTKTASAGASEGHIPTEYLHKLAGALDYMAKQADEGTTAIQPGKGPNTLGVLEATSSEKNIDAGEQGQAKTQIPMSPPMESSGVAKDPSNAMATNDEMQHSEQPEDPMGNEKGASALFARNLEAMGLTKSAGYSVGGAVRRGKQLLTGSKARQIAKDLKAHEGALPSAIKDPLKKQLKKEVGKTVGAYAGLAGGAALAGKALKGKKSEGKEKKAEKSDKAASVALLTAKNLAAMGLYKQAEDAINPAQISAGGTQTGATPPEGASASEEQVPSEPSDVNSQKSMISSNEAAINYTKGQAKADPKSDVNKVLDEKALSSATDKTLAKTLDNTGKAGVKIAADLMKTAAAQAILSKLADEAKAEADKKKNKEKQSQGMGGLSDPSGQSGFTATSV